MAVQDNPTRVQYTASAGQTVFIYPFEVFQSSDLAVEQNGTLLSEGTNYTVSGVGNDNGGNVTLTVGATAGDIITIYRDMALERLTDYQNNGDFLAGDVNEDFDRLWLAIQQNKNDVTSAIRPTINDPVLNSSNTELASPVDRAGKALGFSPTGQLDYLSAALPVGTLREYATIAAALADAASFSIGDVVITSEYSSGNGGGASYSVVGPASGTPDNGSFIDLSTGNQLRLMDRVFSFATFGARNNILSTSELQAALNWASSSGSAIVDYTKNNYLYAEGATVGFGLIIKTNTNIVGNFTLKLNDGTNLLTAGVRVDVSAKNVYLQDFTLDFNRAGQVGSTGNGLVGADDNENINYVGLNIINCANRSFVSNNDAIVGTAIPQPNSAKDIKVTRMSVTNGGDKSIMMRKTQDSVVSDCYVESNITAAGKESGSAFEASQCYKVEFTNSNAKHTGNVGFGPGIRCVNGSQFIKATNISIENGRQGFFITDCSSVKYINCVSINAAFEACIIASDSSFAAAYGLMDDVGIESCTIVNPGQSVANPGIKTSINTNPGQLNGVQLKNNRIFSNDGNMTNGIVNNGDTTAMGNPFSVVEFENEISGQVGARISGEFDGVTNAKVTDVYTDSTVLNNDSFIAIDAPVSADTGIFEFGTETIARFAAGIGYRVLTTAEAAELYNGDATRVDVTTGPLNGTTGTVNNITVSANNDGKIYLENRSGGQRRFTWLFRCASQ